MRTLVGLDRDRRALLAARLGVVVAADAAGRVAAEAVEAAAGRASLGKAMTYRLVRRWRDQKSLSSLLPHAGERRRQTSSSALEESVRAATETAIAKALRRGGRQEQILRRAAAELGPSAPSRTTMVRILRALRSSRPAGGANRGFLVDVVGTGLALKGVDTSERWRIHLCICVDLNAAVVVGCLPCAPADIVAVQAALIDEVAGLPVVRAEAEAETGGEGMRWLSPVTEAPGPSNMPPVPRAQAEALRVAAVATGDAISTDGYLLGSSAAALGNRIDDLNLYPRRTGAARGALFGAGDPEAPLLTIEQASELFSAAVGRHNRKLISARRLSNRMSAAGAAARHLLSKARDQGRTTRAASRSAR